MKQSVFRLVCILFPELEKLVPTLHMVSVYALLSEFPGAKQIADSHLSRPKNLLAGASRGRYGRDMAVEIRDAAKCSIGSRMPAKPLELQHTVRLIQELDAEIEELMPPFTLGGERRKIVCFHTFNRNKGALRLFSVFLAIGPKLGYDI